MSAKRRFRAACALGVSAALIAGCSAKDPLNTTPSYHDGTPTNRSSVNSDELYHEPMYTQPGVNGGLPVHIKLPRVPKTFEPNATAALAAFQVISEDVSLSDRYINVTAQGGTVVVSGSVQTADEKKLALADAKSAKGVTSVIDQLTVKP